MQYCASCSVLLCAVLYLTILQYNIYYIPVYIDIDIDIDIGIQYYPCEVVQYSTSAVQVSINTAEIGCCVIIHY